MREAAKSANRYSTLVETPVQVANRILLNPIKEITHEQEAAVTTAVANYVAEDQTSCRRRTQASQSNEHQASERARWFGHGAY
jgi:hypothetical protein